MPKYFRKVRNSHYIILALLIAIIFFTQMCTSRHDADANPLIFDSYGQAFAGSGSCMTCHKDIYKTHIQTAHYRDSRPADPAFIKGSFDSGRNRFVYNKSIEVMMEHRNGAFYQTSFVNGKQAVSKPFDIVIGSGRKGQTYLYWDDGKLFQLPISYFTPADSWCNSPGYYIDSARFDRQVPAACLECHGTYARTVFHSKTDVGDYFDKSQIIYGIDCERCHGPGAAHVAWQQTHPDERKGMYIINAAKLSRRQRLDACALCHSGSRYPLAPAFSFKVGDTLDKFSQPKFTFEGVSTLDVHGNQYGLLTSSKCFLNSQMDCSSCHNVHVNEAGNPKLFSQRCMTCHNAPAHNTCTMPPTPGLVLSDNCIDCHMPALPSQKIVLALSNVADTGRAISNLVRTHHIAIYTASTKDYLEKLRSRKAPHS